MGELSQNCFLLWFHVTLKAWLLYNWFSRFTVRGYGRVTNGRPARLIYTRP